MFLLVSQPRCKGIAFFIICNSLIGIIIKNAIFLDVNHLMFVRICLEKRFVRDNDSFVYDNEVFRSRYDVQLYLNFNLLKT